MDTLRVTFCDDAHMRTRRPKALRHVVRDLTAQLLFREQVRLVARRARPVVQVPQRCWGAVLSRPLHVQNGAALAHRVRDDARTAVGTIRAELTVI